MRRFLTLFTMLMLFAALAFGQSRVVSGRVTDEKGDGVAFATITEIGTKNVAVADGAGNYQLKISGPGNLSISATGYKTFTETVKGNTSIVVLERSGETIEEVVVTSLGIQRQRKDLGYATAKVNNAELNQAAPVNVANGLQGKVSGLNVTSVNSGVFEDVKINLRGIRSLAGDNNPMLLLDGVQTPLGYLSSINPQDIADVTILKGSSSAGIYGPDARNGVIVVTTKRGGTKNNPVVRLSRTSQFQSISFFPEFQTQFGSGFSGSYVPYENWSWGPAFDGSMIALGDPLKTGEQQMVRYSPTNERKNFFNTGVTNQTDISLSTKEFYISFQDANITGIVPGDKNRRTGIRLNASREYGKFNVAMNMNYIQQNFDVFNDGGMSAYYQGNGVGLNDGLLNLIFSTPAHVPISSYKNFNENPFATYANYYNHYGINPYFALDNWRQNGTSDDLLANIDMKYKANNNLSFTWRLAGNFRNNTALARSKGIIPEPNPVSTATLIPGSVSESFARNSRLSSELFGTWNKRVRDFNFTVIGGTYLRETETNATNVSTSNLVVPELYNISNGVGGVSGENQRTLNRLMSVYGSFGLGYKGWANLEITARNDWASIYDRTQRSFFYPGVNLSLVLSDAFPEIKSGNTISYLKVRGSFNKSGNASLAPYSLASTFNGTAGGFPYTIPGFSADNVAVDPLLSPEFITSREVGFELGLFKNKVNIEVAAYTQDNDDQIIPVQVPISTGYTSARVNAASFVNKGIEFDLKLTPLVNLGDFRVDFKANAAYQNSDITSLFPGIDRLAIGGFADVSNYAIINNPAFVFLANDYQRDDQGRVIVSTANGFPLVDPTLKQFGRSLPLWTLGLSPSVSYKGLTLTVVGEYKGGHFAYADIGDAMAWTGVSKATAQNNRERFVFPNSVYDDGTGKFVPNTDIVVSDVETFYTTTYRDVKSNFITKADSWRIREVSLGYEFPERVFAGQNVIKGLSVSVNARNLFLWLPKSNQFVDPDFNFTTGNAAGVSTSQINPATRLVGFNVTATF